MPKWDIHVGGVEAVLNDAVHAARPLERHSKALDQEMKSAAKASSAPYLDIVVTALQGFYQHAEEMLPEISKELNAVLGGAAKATRAYVEGDEHMAIEAERKAARATGVLPPLLHSRKANER
jgi:hypothetical protein